MGKPGNVEIAPGQPSVYGQSNNTQKEHDMTTIIDAPDVETPDVEEQQDDTPMEETMTAADKKKRERDFSKFRPAHQQLADFVNAHSGLDPITPNQVKALLALRIDFNNLPEQVAARNNRKIEREAIKAKFAGMSPEQVKAQRAADRAEKQAAKLEARVEEARRKADELRAATTASGEDLAAAVEAAQAESMTEPELMPETNGTNASSRRRLGNRRR